MKSVVFFGTPRIASMCLQALIDCKINVVAVVTQPDKPIGRKQEIIYSEVKQLAIKHNIPCFQPENLMDIYQQLQELNPSLILTCAYGKKIPNEILAIPELRCLNVHPSLLPKYRGASPIQSAIINGDKQTGLSIMYMVEKMDAGDVLIQKSLDISSRETYSSLYDKFEELAYETIKENIHKILKQEFEPIVQDELKVSFCKTIKSEDELIDWNKSASEIDCLIRGLYDKPIAHTIYEGLSIKIYEAIIEQDCPKSNPGEITKINKDGIYVSTTNGSIVLKTIQLPSKKPLQVSQLINGNHPFRINSKFTSK